MLVVHLVRHGETDWNRENRFQGRRDVPLNDTGRAQAVKVAAALADRPLAAVWTSGLSRARETAATIAEGRGIEVVTDARFAEMDFGDWEGMTTAEVARAWAVMEASGLDDPRPAGGESYAELQARVGAALRDVAEAHADGEVAVVMHGASLRAAIADVLGAGMPIYRLLRVDNGSLTTLHRRHGRFVIACFNDTCHLGGG